MGATGLVSSPSFSGFVGTFGFFRFLGGREGRANGRGKEGDLGIKGSGVTENDFP